MAETSAGLNVNIDPAAWFQNDSDTAKNDIRWMNDFNWKQSLRNEDFQRELALHGIKMRADDAVSAGFHPLVGAGVNPASGAFGGTSFIGDSSSPRSSGVSLGASQSISRSQAATMTLEEKEIRAAQLASIQANTAESMARKALAEYELQKLKNTPPLDLPHKYNQFRDENGNIVNRMNPEYTQGGGFFQNWADAIQHSFSGPDTRPFWGAVRRGARRSLFLD